MMPYTEALACVLVAMALLQLMRRHYAAVGAIALVLGFTRGVAPALAAAALAHLVIRWREDRLAGVEPLRGQRLTAAVMLGATAVSAVAWPVLVGVEPACRAPFFDVQAAWGQQPDRGPFVLWVTWAWDERGLFGVAVLVALVGTYIALVLGRHGRWLAIELRTWALAYPLYLMAVVRPITSMWRFLLLDFPIAALVASVAMRTSTGASVVPHWRRRVAVVVVALVVGDLLVHRRPADLHARTPLLRDPPLLAGEDRLLLGEEGVDSRLVVGGCHRSGPCTLPVAPTRHRESERSAL